MTRQSERMELMATAINEITYGVQDVAQNANAAAEEVEKANQGQTTAAPRLNAPSVKSTSCRAASALRSSTWKPCPAMRRRSPRYWM
ncbi:hypothetical protein ULF88_20950 [Halopseudomonas pachastrellae]|nr:hypothetical protein [Halopseudomonas pachastrellae]